MRIVNPEELLSPPSFGPDSLRLRTGGSVSVPGVIRQEMQSGWAGLEFLCGIPGLMGGAVVLNAGTHLGEAKDRCLRVETIDLAGPEAGRTRVFEGAKLRFQYRGNLFVPKTALIWSVDWRIDRQPIEAVRQVLTDSLNRRKETQPHE